MALQAGETLGRYQLEGLVGQGGMAVVYRAVDSVLGRTVAVKVIRPAFTEDPQFLERFLQEARVVASLDHPNVLPIFDFGDEKGRPYLVLPYLPGGSLADRMAGQPQPLPLVAAWTIQLAGALDAAHARGVLHRDVKPGNVLVTKDGRLMLGDFGIARLAEATTRLTATGMVVGTPIYMAPELARGADASPASDRYALAVMVFEMIAGQPPFLGTNPLSVLHQQVHEPVPSIGERIAEAAPALDAFLQRALAKEPEQRHRTCRAMAEELVALLSPDQRAELSTLVWSGGTDAGSWAAEAPTVVNPGGTLRMPQRSGAASPAGASAARSAPSAVPRVLTGAVTAEAPRVQRGRPLVWGLLIAAAIAVVVLFVPFDRLIGGKGAAPAAVSTPAGSGAAAVASPEAASAPAATTGTLTAAVPAPSSPAERAAAGPAGTEAASAASPAPETREVTPMEPPALGLPAVAAGREHTRITMAALRRPTHRPTVAELLRIITATDAARRDSVRREPVLAANAWARGAFAHVEGRGDEVTERRQELAQLAAPWGIAWPVTTFDGTAPWEVAALYADPLHELDELLKPKLLGLGNDLDAALAAAYSAHLDGKHAGALGFLDQANVAGTGDARRRALAGQLYVAEAIEAHNEEVARKWLPDALDGGRAPLARAFLVEMTALTTETNGPVAVAAFKDEVCRLVPGTCATLRPLDRQPQRPFNQDGLGRRRRPGQGPLGPRPRPTGG